VVDVHVLHLNVDIQTEQPLVLHLSVLCDHQHILLSYQVLNHIADLLARLNATLQRGPAALLNLN